MNRELKAFQKRFDFDEYCKPDWNMINYRVPDLPNEIWKPIKGWKMFMVSNYGRVKRPLQERSYGGETYPVMYAEKLLKQYHDKKGYAQVTLKCFGRRKTYSVHRLVAEAFLPRLPHQDHVHHKDCDPSNNHVENLMWCIVQENLSFNNRDNKISKGRKEYLAGLSSEERKNITKKAHEKNMRKIECDGVIYNSIKEFSNKIGVTPSAVQHWLSGYNRMPEKYINLGLKYAD